MADSDKPALGLNGPLLARLRQCAADTSGSWIGAMTVYPPEARGLVAFIDAVAGLAQAEMDAAEWACIGCGYHNRGPVCTHCGRPLVTTETKPGGPDA